MRTVIGSDHAGFELKVLLVKHLRDLGDGAIDVATNSTEPVDYPDFAAGVGKTILEGRADRGVVICGSGVGASVAANGVRVIRAGLRHDTYSAHQGVEHDDMNVLVLGARVIGPALAHELVEAFTKAKFTSEERHLRRLGKIKVLEANFRR